MKKSWTRIAVPLIGLLAAGGALALVAFAPSVVFLDGGSRPGSSPAAPPASSEVAQVTAQPVRTRPTGGRRAGAGARETTPASSGTEIAAASLSGTDAFRTLTTSRGLLARGETTGREPTPPPAEEPGKTHGKAKGHGKVKHHGKAKGHAKQGKAKGHTKSQRAGRVAFTPPRGTKPGHVNHSRAQGHRGGRARAHARPRR